MPGTLAKRYTVGETPSPFLVRWVSLSTTIGDVVMSKGMDQKKNQKKQPAKTLQEKRAAKQEKKNSKK
jgi:hypothetical protein